MKLPNPDEAYADIEKLRGYCLNPFHKAGKHKARLFESILGFTIHDAEKLKDILLNAARTCDAEQNREDIYGKRYIIDFTIKTFKGKAEVRSSWIIRTHETFARLTSCYILKSGRK